MYASGHGRKNSSLIKGRRIYLIFFLGCLYCPGQKSTNSRILKSLSHFPRCFVNASAKAVFLDFCLLNSIINQLKFNHHIENLQQRYKHYKYIRYIIKRKLFVDLLSTAKEIFMMEEITSKLFL